MLRVTVRKLDHMGRQVVAYPGQVLQRGPRTIVLRTEWNREPIDLGFVLLKPDDRWTEYFYADKWYNVFEIRAGDGRLKGWYCNITRPARISADEVKAEDLALDLWVTPGGEMQVLDEDEFAALPLSPAECETARQALAELQARVTRRLPPFDETRDDE
jgi:predicted RNA-binding protein associated with RNAse of E/G family